MVVPTADLAASDGPLLEVVKQGPLGSTTKLFSAIGLLALSNGALINMIMASRLIYGMAEERRPAAAVLGIVHPGRRTPWVAILFTTLLGAVLVLTGDLATLAETTVALLVCVFTVVNVSRAGAAPRRRSTTTTSASRRILPVIGIAISIALLTQVEGEAFARAGIVMALGVALWFVNYLVLRREESQGSTT